MKTPTTHPRISKIALLTCLLTLAGCASDGLQSSRQAGTAISAEDKAAQMIGYCQRLQKEGDLANAAGFCERALEFEPTNQVALLSLARIFEQRKAPREAGQAYRAILVLDPENVEARYGLGKTYVALEQYNLALEQLELALQGGGDPRIFNTLGVVNDQLGNHEAAQAAYRQGLSGDAGNIPLQTNLGLSLVLSGRHGEGLMVLRKAAADPAAGSGTRQALTFAYAISGDMTAAEEMALIDLPPDVAVANLAYYDGLRQAGVGTPPPPPAEPMLAEAMESAPEDMLMEEPLDTPEAAPETADAAPMMPLFDPEVATSIALADAEAAQRPWTQWGQLPNYSETVAQLRALFPQEETDDQQPWSLASQSPAEGEQLAMADGGETASDADPAMAAEIDSTALPQSETEDPYLSSLQKLLTELPSAEQSGGQAEMLEPMEAEAMPGMEQAAPMDAPMMAENEDATMAEPEMAKAETADAPMPPKPPASKRLGQQQMADAGASDAGKMEAPTMAEAPMMAEATMAKPAMAAGTDFYAVQLGSFRSPEQAAKGWLQIQSNASDLLGDMDPTFTRADLGETKGVFYRLRTQPTNAKASAKELCGELSKRGIDCLVVKSDAPLPDPAVSSG